MGLPVTPHKRPREELSPGREPYGEATSGGGRRTCGTPGGGEAGRRGHPRLESPRPQRRQAQRRPLPLLLPLLLLGKLLRAEPCCFLCSGAGGPHCPRPGERPRGVC